MNASVLRWVVAGFPLCASAQVNPAPGFEVVDVAVDERFTDFADINDCGQIVFGKNPGPNSSYSEIYMYKNGSVTQITDNRDGDVFPMINNRGQILWGRGIGAKSITQLILYENGVETMIDEFKKSFNGWSLNNIGHVAWSRSQRWRRCPMKENIFSWDGVETRRITYDVDLSNNNPSLNDRDEMAWARTDWCAVPWLSDIRLLTGDGERVLPSPGTQNQGQHLSNAGWVVWNSGIHVMAWNRDEAINVVDWGSVPHLNANGRVYAAVWDFEGGNPWQPWVFDVDDGDIAPYRLADTPDWFSRGRVNEWGETSCVWYDDPYNSQWGGGVLFLRRTRTGDSEFDGDVDLKDHRTFIENMTGPVRTDGLCESRFLDIDYDGDLDLKDFARIQTAFDPGLP